MTPSLLPPGRENESSVTWRLEPRARSIIPFYAWRESWPDNPYPASVSMDPAMPDPVPGLATACLRTRPFAPSPGRISEVETGPSTRVHSNLRGARAHRGGRRGPFSPLRSCGANGPLLPPHPPHSPSANGRCWSHLRRREPGHPCLILDSVLWNARVTHESYRLSRIPPLGGSGREGTLGLVPPTAAFRGVGPPGPHDLAGFAPDGLTGAACLPRLLSAGSVPMPLSGFAPDGFTGAVRPGWFHRGEVKDPTGCRASRSSVRHGRRDIQSTHNRCADGSAG